MIKEKYTNPQTESYSVYMLYCYKSTNTDAAAGTSSAQRQNTKVSSADKSRSSVSRPHSARLQILKASYHSVKASYCSAFRLCLELLKASVVRLKGLRASQGLMLLLRRQKRKRASVASEGPVLLGLKALS
jgi:hypothetical protein